MDYCTETVPLDTVETLLLDNTYLPNSQCWGRLLPLSPNFRIKDISENETTFGRGEDNSVQFSCDESNLNSYFQAYSKVHFKISRIVENSENLLFLHDLSGNGTFINGAKIGKGKRHILNHNDEISLCNAKNKVYLFMDPNNKEDCSLPENLKNKYIMSKIIGRGSYGEVKLAFEQDTNKKFAIKIISKKKFGYTLANCNLNNSLMNEVRIMKELNHPCLIEIKDVYDSDEALYIVMELVSGGELFERVIAKGSLSEAQTKLIFYQIFSGITYLHSLGISHRDLKPENILLMSDNIESLIKITDFGIAKFIDENTVLKTFCGTPTYLAPEILKSGGMGHYTKEIDCWSLGVVLFICLSGFPPFSDDRSDLPLNEQILTANYEHYLQEDMWLNISENAKDLLKKLLTIDPIKRITSADALQHVWFQDDDDMKKSAERLMHPDKMQEKRKAFDENGLEPTQKRQCSDSS